MQSTKILGVITTLLIAVIGWLIYLLDDQINGPSYISNSMKNRAHQLAGLFGSASVRFMQEHNGAAPARTSDIYPKYVKNLESIFPSSIKLRIGCPDANLDTNPETLDLFGIWTLIGSSDDSVLVLNPRVFGRRHVAIYRWKNGLGKTEIVSLDKLNSDLIERSKKGSGVNGTELN